MGKSRSSLQKIIQRTAQMKLALDSSEPEYVKIVWYFYREWLAWNTTVFDSIFTDKDVPVILLSSDLGKAMGDSHRYKYTEHGYPEIRLSMPFLNGDPAVLDWNEELRSAALVACRLWWLRDTLLHEMIHHFTDDYYHTMPMASEMRIKDRQVFECQQDYARMEHGFVFCAKANDIGRRLGLPEVRPVLPGVTVDGVPNAGSDFPHIVRPNGYYSSAILSPSLPKWTPPKKR